MGKKQILTFKFLLSLTTFSLLLVPYSGIITFLVTGIIFVNLGILLPWNLSAHVLACATVWTMFPCLSFVTFGVAELACGRWHKSSLTKRVTAMALCWVTTSMLITCFLIIDYTLGLTSPSVLFVELLSTSPLQNYALLFTAALTLEAPLIIAGIPLSLALDHLSERLGASSQYFGGERSDAG